MLNLLVSIINGGVNFQSLTIFILIYCASIWVLLCLWVFLDAKRRYEKFLAGLAFFVIVLIFNFPGLIFYLIIRPDKNEDNFFYLQNNDLVETQENGKGGVDIPIVNFVNENGEVNLSFQLKINKNSGATNIQVGKPETPEAVQVKVDMPSLITSSSNSKEEQPKVEIAQVSSVETQPVVSVTEEQKKGGSKFTVSFSALKSKFSSLRGSQNKVKQTFDSKDENKDSEADSSLQTDYSPKNSLSRILKHKSSKKKKKKRNR